MELFVFRHAEYERLYNCTGLEINSVPIENRRFVPESIILIALSTVYYILYIPCLMSIWRHFSESACYKLLLFIGLMDVAILWIPGLLHGWLSLNGTVFCSHPLLLYFTGLATYAGWMVESTADLILAVERCVEIISPEFSDRLFRGRRLLFWIGICLFYGVVALIFEKPVVFNGIFFAWLFNPFAGYRDDANGTFENIFHAIHNLTIGIFMPLFYLAFAVVLSIKWSHGQNNMSRAQKMVFLQVFIFSAMNTVSCIIYVAMQFVEVRQWMITLAQFCWFHVHGFPPVVYLLLNKTIRNDCLKMFYKVFDPKRIKHIYGITVLVVPKSRQVVPSGGNLPAVT